MKRLWISLIIFVVLLTFSIYCIRLTNDLTSKLETNLSIALDAAQNGNTDRAWQYTKLVQKEWETSKNMFYIYIRHNEFIELTEIINSLNVCLESDNLNEFMYTCNRGISHIINIRELEQFTLINIL